MVSEIIPDYNSAKTIKNSIGSEIDKTYTDWELFVVDNASTDNTADIVKEYMKKDT
jgi:glycosyltransferase involved in cell wall biosynthesis